MRYVLAAILALAGGCLPDAADDNDGSAAVMDLGSQSDLEGADLYGFLNCAALDKAEAQCKADNATCVSELRKMATPSAVTKDEALQQCFHMYCPLSGVCTPDGSGNYTTACQTCVANTLKSSPSDCSPASAPECTKCYNQGQACLND
jgi:hypothetical protein